MATTKKVAPPASNVLQLRPKGSPRDAADLVDAAASAIGQRHRVALEFARELVTLLSAGVPTSDADWVDPSPDPDFGSRDRPWVDPDGWRRWQALKAAETARKHWLSTGRQDDMPRRIRAVKNALDLAKDWKPKHAPPSALVIRGEAARDAPELASIPLAEWTKAIARWPDEHRGRGGDPRTRPTPWHVVVFEILEPYGLTSAKDASSMKRAFERAPKLTKRRRGK